MEHLRVGLAHGLARGIRRERVAGAAFDLGQSGVIAIHGAARCINETLHTCDARGVHEMQSACDVRRVRVGRALDAAGHGAEAGLVQNVVAADHRTCAGGSVRDVTFDEKQVVPLVVAHLGEHVVDVLAMAGREIVEHHDLLIQLQQRLGEMRADEACASGD